METSERRPWSIDSVLEQLDSIRVGDTGEILRALHREGEALAAALREELPQRNGRAKLIASVFLLLLNDRSGRGAFLAALAGPDGALRTEAIECLRHDVIPSDCEIRDGLGTTCPIRSDELLAMLRRDLHEPWTGLSRTVLEIVARRDYPAARAITRPLLTHADASLRLEIAETYLRAGRDEGAFAVVEARLRAVPGHVSGDDPRRDDFREANALWYFLEPAVERGDAALRSQVAALVKTLVTQALDARDVKEWFDCNDGLIEGPIAAKVLAAVMPAGAQELLERMIACEALSEFDRGQALLAYARALGDQARPLVLANLRREELREAAAQALEPLVKGRNDPHEIAALSDALAGEERPGVVAAISSALMAAGPAGEAAASAALDRSDPWTKVELAWRLTGGTDREFADLLTESGVMDPISDEQLAEAFSKGFNVLELICAGGDRLAVFEVKSSSGMEHFDLFQQLLTIARPVVVVEDLKETCLANLVREPVEGAPNVQRVTDLGTVCTLSFRYQGETFSFETHPEGRWHDVDGVQRGFDTFMESIGRDDRCYEIQDYGEWTSFVVAPASKFEPIAKRLRIPLERDSESARDAAKDFQRRVQEGCGGG